MLAELKAKSQLTIPSQIVKEMNLEVGDMFDVVTRPDGSISLIPVVVYPKARAEELERIASSARDAHKRGDLAVYESASDAIAALHVAAE